MQCCGLSVVDPDPDLWDPYVFGAPGSASGSVRHKCGSGSSSGSFHHQTKMERKTLISTMLLLYLYDFLQCSGSGSVGAVCYVPSRSGSVRLRYLDPYQYQNVTDLQHGVSP
jgi:hypothetical protein